MGSCEKSGLIGEGSPEPRHHAGDSPAVLALHGFGSTPREVDLIVDVAAELGLQAHAPLLPGHGTNVQDLQSKTFEDWYEAARLALVALHESHGKVIVCGMSLGALLALRLADREQRCVKGLILLATALELHWPYPDLVLRAHRRFRLPNITLRKSAPDIIDVEARGRQLTYGAESAKAAAQVLRAGEAVENRLSAIAVPTLIVHGAKDNVVPPSTADRLFEGLGTLNKRVGILPKSGHSVTRDFDRDALRLNIVDHIQSLIPTSP